MPYKLSVINFVPVMYGTCFPGNLIAQHAVPQAQTLCYRRRRCATGSDAVLQAQIQAQTLCYRLKRCAMHCSEPSNGAEVVADILEHIGHDKGPQPHGLGPQAASALEGSLRKSGSIRLKDALVVAHIMQQQAADQQVGHLLPSLCCT